ncbi:hypothetical protein [Roseovarius sp. D0-M9]|uniref:hypothetical protein n=1 Tax=Roseovarius sp. D0-M9 TaxID=3127117 RepID=UPI00301014D8
MITITQKRLAIFGAVAAASLFIVINAQFIAAAFRSQPACVAVADAAMPAKQVC